MIPPVVEGKPLQELLCSNREILLCDSIESADETHELHSGQLFIEKGPVRNKADDFLCFFRIFCNIDPGDRNGPFRCAEDSGHHAQGCRFSCAVGSYEPKELPLFHGQVQMVNGKGAPISFRQIYQFYHLSIPTISNVNLPIRPVIST